MKETLSAVIALCSVLTTAAIAEEGAEKACAEKRPSVLTFDSCCVSRDRQGRIDTGDTDGVHEILIVEMTGDITFSFREDLLTLRQGDEIPVCERHRAEMRRHF